MEMSQIIDNLKKEANNNSVAKDIFEYFCSRERARQTLTVDALYKRMTLEGIKHSRYEYAAVISVLSALGIGKLNKDLKGRVKGLTNVNYTLKSVGEAALGKINTLESSIVSERTGPTVKAYAASNKDRSTHIKVKVLELDVEIGGKLVKVQLPTEVTRDELINLISFFKQ
jgi:hypothetical protein